MNNIKNIKNIKEVKDIAGRHATEVATEEPVRLAAVELDFSKLSFEQLSQIPVHLGRLTTEQTQVDAQQESVTSVDFLSMSYAQLMHVPVRVAGLINNQKEGEQADQQGVMSEGSNSDSEFYKSSNFSVQSALLQGSSSQSENSTNTVESNPVIDENQNSDLSSDDTNTNNTIVTPIITIQESIIVVGSAIGYLIESNVAQSIAGMINTNTGIPIPFFAQTNVAGSSGYGTFSINSAGAWIYTMNNAHNEFVGGVNYTDTITVSTIDGIQQLLIVVIAGTNDPAIISGISTDHITQGSTPSSVLHFLSVTDVDSPALFVAQANVPGSSGYGKFSISDSGVWIYTMDNAHEEFVSGINYTDSITVSTVDGTTKLLSVTMTGTNLSDGFAPGNMGGAVNLNLVAPVTNNVGPITLTISNVPINWTFSENISGMNNGDGTATWIIQPADFSSLTVTALNNFSGAVVFPISMDWVNPDNTAGHLILLDNIAIYPPGDINSGDMIISQNAVMPFNGTFQNDGIVHIDSGALILDGALTGTGPIVLTGSGTIEMNQVSYDINHFIQGNSGGNVLIGTVGDDLIIGEQGVDTLTGNGGANTFLYQATVFEGVGNIALADIITDYTPGLDHIDIGTATFNAASNSASSGDVIIEDGPFLNSVAVGVSNGDSGFSEYFAVLMNVSLGSLDATNFISHT